MITPTVETTLINFCIPNHLKYHLDRLVKFKNISRTSLLNRLVEEYVRDEEDQLEKDGRIQQMMLDLEMKYQTSVLKHTPQSVQTPRYWESQIKKKEVRWEDTYDVDEPLTPLFDDGMDRW